MGRKAFNMFFSFLYPMADFLTITFAILLSYKVYRILGIGQYVYYGKIYTIPMSLMASLAAVIVLFVFGAYKRESSLLNVEEIKNVVKGKRRP